MLFTSLDFFLFFPVVLGLYYLLPLMGRQVMLLAASLVFYMYWRVPYVGLLVLSGVVDYCVGRCLGKTETPRYRKCWLLVSLCVNLGVLGFFKYYNFFLDSLDSIGLAPSFLQTSQLLLPLGISFYTFQTMSYTIDVYRRQIPVERNPVKFLLYVSFFPQLVAGPIVRAKQLLPQFDVKHEFEWDNLIIGARRVLTGFVKKVVLADNLALLVDPVYAAPDEYSGAVLLLATYAFAFQILCDFSGYSDMAIGLARMMGFRFLENFNMPYISRSIQEFWRRWHISLSTWLRDYLYVSLGGNRLGTLKTYRNLMITMLLGGLWHGASFNFIIWGGIHGVWLSIERLVTRRAGHVRRDEDSPRQRRFLPGVLMAILVFHGVCLSWVFFRAQDLPSAIFVIGRILTWSAGATLQLATIAQVVMISVFSGLYFVIADRGDRRHNAWWWLAGVFGIVVIVLFGRTGSEFIYFVF